MLQIANPRYSGAPIRSYDRKPGLYSDPQVAHEFVKALRWPNGVACQMTRAVALHEMRPVKASS